MSLLFAAYGAVHRGCTMKPRLLRAILLVALIALAPFSAVAADAADAIRARINSDILGTDPAGKRDENTDAVLLHMVEGLVAYREDASIGPLLAESWEISPDGKEYRFHLRDGVRFHNGAMMTAADVVWSFTRYLNPATHWRCLPEFDGRTGPRLLSVEAEDSHTVRFLLDRPFPLLLKMMARADCGESAILHRDSVDANGRWREPIGTGPYQFSTWRPNQFVELRRFPLYSSLPGPRDGNTGGKRAAAETIRFLVIPDASAAQGALLSGAIDVLHGVLPNMLSYLRQRGGQTISIQPTMDSYALLFQTSDPLLQNPLLRRAIAHAIDVPALVAAISQGAAIANASIVPSTSVFHTAAHQRVHEVNLQLARELAAASGYQGQKIALITNRRYPQMLDAALVIQAMARKAGIKFELEIVDWATELDHFQRGAYQSMLFAYSARLDPSFSYGTFIGAKRAEPRKVWDDPVASELLAVSMATDEQSRRQAAFDQLHARFLDQAPAIMLFNSADVTAISRRVSGYAGWAAVQPRFWDVNVTR